MRTKSSLISEYTFIRKTSLGSTTKKIASSLFVLLFTQSLIMKVFSQNQGLTINLKNVAIETVLNKIESQSEYRFLYNKELVDVTQKVSLDVTNADIKSVLPELFKGTNINYIINSKQIVLNTKSSEDSKKLTGKVVEENGTPVIGASILIKGTKTGTITNYEGNFSLDAEPDQTLVVSYIGYKSKEVKVGGQKFISVKLEEDVKNLSEVVVTALGIRREERALGYAVQAVKGDGLQTVKGVDMATSLTGKVSGLLVKNSTEFTQSPDIQIRGENPLIVIDGVPYGNMSLSEIPSDDIENISVLKGATASALYGYRGAGGAIMVTTKKDKKEKGIDISFNSGSMFASGFLAIPELQSTFGRVVNTATNTYSTGGDGSWGVPMDGRDVKQWDPVSKSWQVMPYLPRGKDNFKNFLEPGYVLNNNLNIVQQGEFGNLRASATWVNNKGQYPNSLFNKYTYSIGGDIKLNNFLLSTGFSYNKHTSPHKGFSGYTSYDPMYSMLVWSAADYDIRDYKDYWLIPNESQNNSYTDSNNNPYFDRYERTHSINKDIINGTLSITYNFTDWLKLALRSGFDTYIDRQNIRVSKGSLVSAGSATLIPNGSQVWGESANGSYNTGISKGYSFNNDLIFSGNKTFDKFSIDGFFGTTLFYKQDEGIEARTQDGLSIPGYYSLNASVSPAKVASLIYRRQVNSLYGRLALSWNNLIYAEGTLRNDWSSTLPQATRSYLYPSLSGSFVVSELLPKSDWLSLWKLRGSWTNSKTPADVYSINSVYTITNSAWGSLSSAAYPVSVRSAVVLPASSETFEAGTAVNLWANRASVDVSYYTKRMYDGLTWGGVSPASGFTSNYVNTDEEVTRRGVEISATVVPVKTNDWRWDVTANWSKYARYFTQLDSVYSEDRPWVKVGERYDAYVVYDYLRDPSGNIIHNAGKPLYSEYQSKLGYSDPDWLWGLSTSLRYKNFQFAMSMDGRVGGLTQTITEMYMWRAGSHPNSVTAERMLDATVGGNNYVGEGVKVVSGAATFDTYGNIISDDRVFAPNDVATTYESYINNLHKGTAWGGAASPVDVYSTTFLKIREMSLTYTFPKSICEKMYTKAISLSAVGQNLLLWSKQFKYSDPDGGVDNFSDPSIRYVGFNLKVNF
jgi:TonB-linked SusC/RagA family outer membrane protein